MPIKTKRWDDPREADDGFRLLVCRFRPRALPKAGETWDAWEPGLGPSRELLAAYHGKTGNITWQTYRARYLAEMRRPEAKALIGEVAKRVARGQTVTLLCSSACVREARCHRSLLKELVEAEVSRAAGATHTG